MAWITVDTETRTLVIRFDEPPPAKYTRFEEYTPCYPMAAAMGATSSECAGE